MKDHDQHGDKERHMPLAPLRLDLDKYLHHAEGEDISDEQARMILTKLWEIMRSAAEIGWGVHQIQLFSDEHNKISGQDSGDLLELEGPQTFNAAAITAARKEGTDE